MAITFDCSFAGVPATVIFEPVNLDHQYIMRINHVTLDKETRIVVVSGSVVAGVPTAAVENLIGLLEQYYFKYPETIMNVQLGVIVEMK